MQATRLDRQRGETGHWWPRFLPDGRRALFTIFSGGGLNDAQVGILHLDTAEYEPLFAGAAARYLSSGHVVYYRAGAYYAAPFDPEQGRRIGPDVPVLDDVVTHNPRGSMGSYFAFSDTGTLLYFGGAAATGSRTTSLAWASRDGDLERLRFDPARFRGGRLSPDRRRLAVSRQDAGTEQLWLYDFDRGTEEQLTRTGLNFRPIWSAEGGRLAFVSMTDGNFDIRWSALDGSVVEQPLFATQFDDVPLTWTSDDQLLFTQDSGSGDGRDLWSMQVGSPDSAREVLTTRIDEAAAALSPDGLWIAYVSGRNLYIASYPDLTGRVTVDSQVLDSVVWSWSTSELLYRTIRGGINVVPFRVESGVFLPEAPSAVMSGGSFVNMLGVSADGDRLLVTVLTADEEPPRINVVHNWFSELTERVPVP